jgi:hypothetical protein
LNDRDDGLDQFVVVAVAVAMAATVASTTGDFPGWLGCFTR